MTPNQHIPTSTEIAVSKQLLMIESGGCTNIPNKTGQAAMIVAIT
jgi:hypothetical protein